MDGGLEEKGPVQEGKETSGKAPENVAAAGNDDDSCFFKKPSPVSDAFWENRLRSRTARGVDNYMVALQQNNPVTEGGQGRRGGRERYFNPTTASRRVRRDRTGMGFTKFVPATPPGEDVAGMSAANTTTVTSQSFPPSSSYNVSLTAFPVPSAKSVTPILGGIKKVSNDNIEVGEAFVPVPLAGKKRNANEELLNTAQPSKKAKLDFSKPPSMFLHEIKPALQYEFRDVNAVIKGTTLFECAVKFIVSIVFIQDTN